MVLQQHKILGVQPLGHIVTAAVGEKAAAISNDGRLTCRHPQRLPTVPSHHCSTQETLTGLESTACFVAERGFQGPTLKSSMLTIMHFNVNSSGAKIWALMPHLQNCVCSESRPCKPFVPPKSASRDAVFSPAASAASKISAFVVSPAIL